MIWKFDSNSVFNLSTIALHLLLKIIQYENLRPFTVTLSPTWFVPAWCISVEGLVSARHKRGPEGFPSQAQDQKGGLQRLPLSGRIHLPAQGTWVPSLV